MFPVFFPSWTCLVCSSEVTRVNWFMEQRMAGMFCYECLSRIARGDLTRAAFSEFSVQEHQWLDELFQSLQATPQ